MIITAAKPEDLPWVELRTGCVLTRNAKGIKALDARGNIRGMVAFDGWTENSVQCHVASDTAMAWKRLLQAGREYVFLQVGKGLLYASIRSDNLRALRFAQHACMEVEHRFRDAHGPGVDMVVVRMCRADVMLQFEGLENAA